MSPAKADTIQKFILAALVIMGIIGVLRGVA